MKNIIICVTVFAAYFLFSCSVNAQNGAGVAADLSAREFSEKIKTLKDEQILDVRTPEEWADGIISNAHKINFYDKDFDKQVKQLDNTKPVMVYCAAGGRSAKAMKKMKDLGFIEIYNLTGGMGAWKKAGFEVVK